MKTPKHTVKLNATMLEGIREKLSEGHYAKIGVLSSGQAGEEHMASETINVGGKQYRKKSKVSSGMTNAELAARHELGSYSDSLPQRSFLLMPLEYKRAALMEVFKGNSKARRMVKEGDIEGALQILGIKAEAIIQEAFETGGFGKWQGLSDATIAKKGSSAILIETAQLRRAVTSEVEKR